MKIRAYDQQNHTRKLSHSFTATTMALTIVLFSSTPLAIQLGMGLRRATQSVGVGDRQVGVL